MIDEYFNILLLKQSQTQMYLNKSVEKWEEYKKKMELNKYSNKWNNSEIQETKPELEINHNNDLDSSKKTSHNTIDSTSEDILTSFFDSELENFIKNTNSRVLASACVSSTFSMRNEKNKVSKTPIGFRQVSSCEKCISNNQMNHSINSKHCNHQKHNNVADSVVPKYTIDNLKEKYAILEDDFNKVNHENVQLKSTVTNLKQNILELNGKIAGYKAQGEEYLILKNYCQSLENQIKNLKDDNYHLQLNLNNKNSIDLTFQGSLKSTFNLMDEINQKYVDHFKKINRDIDSLTDKAKEINNL